MSTGCLCIHGYTGSPEEVEPLVDYLHLRTDWEFKVPTLPGHGTELDLRGHYYQEWIATAELALLDLKSRHDTILIIGFSMGGMIASYLAAKHEVDRLVLLSAALKYISFPQLVKDTFGIAADAWKGTLTNNPLFVRYQTKMKQTHFLSSFEFMKCVEFTKPYLQYVKCPTLIFQGKLDGMVPSRAANFLEQEIGSSHKKVVFLPNSKHLVCHDEDRDTLCESVLYFLSKLSYEKKETEVGVYGS
ncbi:alpha/beta fold hydrolase [Halobacillus sp. A5]|uniref:alpha/beta hydrolase n=1 Tax=Halobacillus sp. A5 TaxID=2880263 RepID=UPI0020A69A08|nr:alpha/beta fold hydrolase [Halobacillus sp. A5]